MEDHDYLREAYEALKRADHLYYVSLKYARTVDVMRTILERLEDALTALLLAIIQHEVEAGKRDAFPESKPEQARAILSLDEAYQPLVQRRLFLRRLLRAPYTREREFRKAVTMIATLDGEPVHVTTETVKDYIDEVKEAFQHIYEEIRGVDDDIRFF